MVCCDTSFLISLYRPDSHSEKTLGYMRRLTEPVQLSPLNEFELGNALRLACRRRLMVREDLAVAMDAFASDCRIGRFIIIPCNLSAVLVEARRLSGLYTVEGGYRSFDVLHVAAALHLGAGEFLSFDTNQRKLAAKEGLKLNN
jgi:predicted nucleic acid-binding protein